ncbi:MAG: hypothetical protein LBG89_02245 [Rickettsiales bacterium]|jgi:hypothetical protein|nr:hypothetical protein [Rickettsiales bacterium]
MNKTQNPSVKPAIPYELDDASFAKAARVLEPGLKEIFGKGARLAAIHMSQVREKDHGRGECIPNYKQGEILANPLDYKYGKGCAFRMQIQMAPSGMAATKMSSWFFLREFPDAKLCYKHGYSYFADAVENSPSLRNKILSSFYLNNDFGLDKREWSPLSNLSAVVAESRQRKR